jgi:hypothetical protein
LHKEGDEMSETIRLIGYATTIVGFIGALIAFWSKIKDVAEGQQCQLRNDITAIYYRHCDETNPSLREYERKNLDSIYAAYKALRGNHYIDDLYEQMRHWRVTK